VTLRATSTPLAPLSPVEPAAEDADKARNTLIGFFANLSAGNYAEAAARFGGEVDEYLRDTLPGESVDEYWNFLCDYYWCLPVAEITDMEQISEDKFIFYTVFMLTGSVSRLGRAAARINRHTPPVWQLLYCSARKIGEWKMRPAFTLNRMVIHGWSFDSIQLYYLLPDPADAPGSLLIRRQRDPRSRQRAKPADLQPGRITTASRTRLLPP
jgi:hypothetical protein